ncbi:MAG TPA: hypothetical protein VNM45_10455 [Bacillus sp. (in: firmicutes)]|nr:hypothetical protein [Bacillus sp. (in: firmicutes)]
MLRNAVKTAGLLFAALFLIGLGGCNTILEAINNGLTKVNKSLDADFKEEAKAEAVAQMEEKYGIDFEVHDIFREEFSNESTVWMHPVDNQNIKFEVSLDSNNKVENDNFIGMKISNEITAILKDNLPSGIEMAAIIYSFGDSNKSNEINQTINENREKLGVNPINGESDKSVDTKSNLTLEEYIQAYDPEYFSGYMIVKDTGDITPEMFAEAFKKVYKATSNRVFQVNVHFITPERYAECHKGFTERLYTNSGFLSEFDNKEMGFQANEKGFFTYEP